MKHEIGVVASRKSAKADGIDDFCMSLKKCTSSGVFTDSRWSARARQFAVGAAFVAGLDGLNGGLARGRWFPPAA
jgi:hypothetical protein